MLIIDYSCGVRLSTATALSATIATAARQSVLIKGGNYIEQLVGCDTLVLDKTGTVTEGRPIVTSVIPSDPNTTPKKLMEYAAAAEETATHPMAQAILTKVRREGWRIPKHGNTEIITGRGVETTIGNHRVRVGNRRFMTEKGLDVSPVHETVSRLAVRGESVIYIASSKRVMGIVGIQDVLKDNMKKALNRVRKTGIDDVILLTGDIEQQAEVVATRISADAFHAEVLPETKSEVVLQLQSKGVPVIMVGDGINDAPALAYADVGIAMGATRTDIAVEAADITISNDNPLLLPGVMKMASRCMSIIKQNFAAAIGINSAGLLLASFGVLPVFWGAVLHNATTIAVVANSARMLLYDIEEQK